MLIASYLLSAREPCKLTKLVAVIIYREYETVFTMTSRIVKTYSRKAGDGTSKFDEVLSNKRATLSTKWGETTYKAQLGSKRPSMKAERPDRTKKPKMAEDGDSEDPFGFDSDDESKPVSSRNVSKSPAKLGYAEAGLTLEPNSRVNQPASVEAAAPSWPPTRTLSMLSADKSSVLVPEDSGKFFSSTTSGKTHGWSSENTEHHSYSWYKNASESDRKPLAQTTTLKSEKSEDNDSFDVWGAIVGLGSRSTSPLSASRDSASSTWTSGSSLLTKPPAETSVTEVGQVDLDLPVEPSESEDHSQSLLRASNCRTYCRPNKSKPSTFGGTSNSEGAGSRKDGEGKSRGRTRDYTVLHPSSMSACNVTIQDSMERGIEEYTPSAPAADPGEAGRLRKKVEPETKPARSRSTQNKTKKESKLDLFGFDDGDAPSAGDPVCSGSSNYKIKYFGFDDLSDSDGDEDEDEDRPRKTKRMASIPAEVSGVASVEVSRPKASQENSSTDPLETPEVNSRTTPEVPKRPQVKPQEKTKESSRRIFSGPKRSPTKAVYNARHWNQPEPEELPPPPPSASQAAPATSSGSSKESNSHKGDEGVFKTPPLPPKVTKSVTVPTEPYQDIVTALKCRKEHKELYTVVQHVKHFNDVVEFGENQEFTDDFEYLATGLKSGQPLNTRCLSVISLATRCALPSFRMHLRARGKVAQVFKTINDAPQHPNLALCTASLMYILSRDRLNMDLDRASLELMIRLLELEQDKTADSHLSAKEMSKVKERIRKLCETVHNKHLDLENITTGHLAMETLLSLTSKRAGDWFKEELRLLGGLDHIVDKVKECVENLSCEDDKENLVASLWGAERCLRVLESVTVHNSENQAYLIAYKDSQLIVSSAKALRHCEEMIQRYSRDVSRSTSGSSQPHCSVGKAVQDCMRAVIGVLLNLTHDNEWGSTKTGEQEDLIITALNCVLRVPQYLPQEQRFDIRVLGLGLLINLVEYSARNRHCLVEMQMDGGELWDSVCVSDKEELNTEGSMSAIAALVKLFLQREHAAVLAEAETDDFINDVPTEALDQSGEWQETSGEIQWVASEDKGTENQNKKKDEDEEELDLNKALQHAGKHMEDSIVASYTALLLGCLCQGSPMNVSTVRENLPKGDFSIMTEMLKKFLNFMNLTCDVGTTGQKSISRVIDYLEHC
ncbi:wings apart-like protein homolog isoform X2 [Tachysurus fulvidraco]|uniref:wings apart-like protein homolog isoform X2 n=1 Tax=Tachysurus fulvidraco TaxID=1234273 RepID=UPI001FEFB8E8|nr:wings apart-like protein homolog isoform X2 [Tachysurus fulvidraco]